MNAKERQKLIFDTITRDGIIRISQIATTYDVSIETARKDLINLQDMGLVARISGGAIPNPWNVQSAASSSAISTKDRFSEMIAIASEAAKMVHDGQTIFLDTGSTIQLMARQLKDRRCLTVLTYSLTVMQELLYTDVKVIFLGGAVMSEEQMTYGDDTREAMSKYYVDQAFFSCMGASFEEGITDLSFVLNRRFLRQHSDRMILLADSSKWGIHSKVFACPLSVVDTFIVDDHTNKETLEKIESLGKELIVAEVNEDSVANNE